MLATKLSISLDPQSLDLLNQVQTSYRCANRSQAVARALQLFKEVTEQRELERAYAASGAQDLVMDSQFKRAHNDGLADETW